MQGLGCLPGTLAFTFSGSRLPPGGMQVFAVGQARLSLLSCSREHSLSTSVCSSSFLSRNSCRQRNKYKNANAEPPPPVIKITGSPSLAYLYCHHYKLGCDIWNWKHSRTRLHPSPTGAWVLWETCTAAQASLNVLKMFLCHIHLPAQKW